MSVSIYKKIQDNCKQGIVNGKPVYVSPHQHWLIGSYADLRQIAPKLRSEPDLLDHLNVPGGKIRFGGREKDTFSTLSRLRSFRRHIDGKPPEVLPEYLVRQFDKNRKGEHNGKVRLTDMYEIAKKWYDQATLEVHHIVEKDLLHKLKLDKDDLEPDKAPCVLIVAELHRRLFTPEGSKYREEVILASTQADALIKLKECNTALYPDSRMSDILKIGNLIIDELKY